MVASEPSLKTIELFALKWQLYYTLSLLVPQKTQWLKAYVLTNVQNVILSGIDNCFLVPGLVQTENSYNLLAGQSVNASTEAINQESFVIQGKRQVK